jgi:hypothetical protein
MPQLLARQRRQTKAASERNDVGQQNTLCKFMRQRCADSIMSPHLPESSPEDDFALATLQLTGRSGRQQAKQTRSLMKKGASFGVDSIFLGRIAKVPPSLRRDFPHIDRADERAIVFSTQLVGKGEFSLELLIVLANSGARLHTLTCVVTHSNRSERSISQTGIAGKTRCEHRVHWRSGAVCSQVLVLPGMRSGLRDNHSR